MKRLLTFCIYYTLRFMLLFRYRIKFKGLENLNSQTLNKPGGVLFLPNHPTAFIDPVVVTLGVWHQYPVRPMVIDYMYNKPGVNFAMRLINALSVPDFSEGSNSYKKKKIEGMMQTVIHDLKKGDNFLVYPGGRLKNTGIEEIGANSAAHRLVQEAPETNVVLVRIKGLWGSSFSKALTGKTPSMFATVLHGIKIVLKNFIFFTPKREITVEFVPAPANFPTQAPRLEFNKYLENWYNQPDGLSDQKAGDSLIFVSYSCFRDEFPALNIPKPSQEENIKWNKIPAEIKEKVNGELARIACVDKSAITQEKGLGTDLGLDSLDIAELHAYLHDQFDVTGVPIHELTTVGKTWAIAAKQITFKESAEEVQQPILAKWFKPLPPRRCSVAPGETIPEIFLNNCARLGGQVSCGDTRSGVLTYSEVKLRTILLAEYIRTLPGVYIGVLMPASVPAYLCVLACQLAGKIPLMVNWTIGPRHLESVVQLSKVQVVLTSWAFIDRLDNVDFNGIDDKLKMLEDVRHEFGPLKKLNALYWSKRSTQAILKHFGTDKKSKNDIAALLFTSGTESMPKGVPLSHENLLSNHRDALNLVGIYSSDCMYGFLPPFHSFGLSLGGLLAFVAGIKICFSPDPTNGSQLVHMFDKWGVTVFCSAPTFVKNMLKAATKEQLKNLRLCITGAEKTPPELVMQMESIGKKESLSEGYGITECGPVLTLNVPGNPIIGVGKPLPSVQIRIVHPESFTPLPVGEQGMIIAKGSNIFSGYINPDIQSPFIEFEGEKWYITGDLGFLDRENNLTISGRKKRFIKIGGEMVSLSAIENALLGIAAKKKEALEADGPTVAICATEKGGEKPQIYLFTKFHTNTEEANEVLKESGFSNLVKINSVFVVDDIPVMGTGKINYRLLEAGLV